MTLPSGTAKPQPFLPLTLLSPYENQETVWQRGDVLKLWRYRDLGSCPDSDNYELYDFIQMTEAPKPQFLICKMGIMIIKPA